MKVVLTRDSIVLKDTNFNLEVYKPSTITEIKSILEFDEEGYMLLDTNIGDLIINWDSNDYPLAVFHAKFKIESDFSEKKYSIEKGVKVLRIDNLLMWAKKEGNFYRIFVKDTNLKYNKAVFIYDGILSLQHSSFKYNSTSYWKMRYLIEANYKDIVMEA